MKKFVIATLLLASIGAQAQTLRDRAEVISVHEVSEEVNRPTERCWTETVERAGPEHNAAGAITGALIGGVLGHQIGHGRGRDIATGVGVLAGAAVGDNAGNSGPTREEQRKCAREEHWVREVTGFEVTYRYAGQLNTVIMPQRPGRTIDVDVTVSPVVR